MPVVPYVSPGAPMIARAGLRSGRRNRSGQPLIIRWLLQESMTVNVGSIDILNSIRFGPKWQRLLATIAGQVTRNNRGQSKINNAAEVRHPRCQPEDVGSVVPGHRRFHLRPHRPEGRLLSDRKKIKVNVIHLAGLLDDVAVVFLYGYSGGNCCSCMKKDRCRDSIYQLGLT